MRREISSLLKTDVMHWVGNGFPVKTLFDYSADPQKISPFLLLDYASKFTFPPLSEKRGVGEHPHRGFETVTIVYEGELAHRDSNGGGGVIGKGDVQWMTAASGLVHEEYHSEAFSKNGGVLQMVQLWVNLPARYKSGAPNYQAIKKDDIQSVHLPQDAGTVRVIAGKFDDKEGPAKTKTPMNIYDILLDAGHTVELPVTDGFSLILITLEGEVTLSGDVSIKEGEGALFDLSGNILSIHQARKSRLLFLSGEIIPEPVVGSGPFVMNTRQEIQQAIQDYRQGFMGNLG